MSFLSVKALRASDDASVILVEWTIADDQVTIATLEIQQGGEGSWELVKGASQLNRSVSEFKVSDLKADSSYRFRMDMRRPGESSPAYVYSDTGTCYNLINVREVLIMRAAERAFLRPWEDWKRVGER